MRASGRSGVLRVGYQWAATLGAWRLDAAEARIPRAFAASAKVIKEHSYWIAQEPIDLVLHLGKVEWVWRGVTLQREGDLVSATLAERPIVEQRTDLVEEGAR